jgi:hypothetical protein
MTVADISHMVGYNSIGTFSSRFRFSVGYSPTDYRRHDGYVAPLDEYTTQEAEEPADSGNTVRGHLSLSGDCNPGEVIVAVFPDRIAQSVPVCHAVVSGDDDFVLEDVPDGNWHVMATTVEGRAEDDGGEEYVGTVGPVTVRANAPAQPVNVRLRSRVIFDPPALLAHLDHRMLATLGSETPDTVEESVEEPVLRAA